MSNDSSRSHSGGNRSRSNNNRNRSNRSNRSGGDRNRDREFRGDPNSRPPAGGSSQRRFVKQKVPRRTTPPTLWEKFLKLIGLGGPQRRPQPQREQTPRNETSTRQSKPAAGRERSERSERSRDSRSSGSGSSRSSRDRPSRDRPKRDRPKRSAEKIEVTCPRLYVGNLSYDTREDDLEKLFAEIGEVASAEVVCNPRNQRSKGFAFVEMADIDDAKRAVETLHDKSFMGREILVSGAKSAGPKTREQTQEDA